jgi:hypothetical protein
MVIDFEYCLNQMDKLDIMVLIKDGKFYYPMIELSKPDENSKNIKITKLFNKADATDKLIDEIKKYFTNTINDIKIDQISTHTSARETYVIVSDIAKKNKEFEVINQVIDSRFKCKYLITKNNTIIPVVPSGIINNIPTICFNSYTNDRMRGDCFTKLNFYDIEQSNQMLEKLYNISNKKLNIKPIGLFYDSINDKDMVNIIGIMTSNIDLVPVKQIQIPKAELEKNKVLYQNRPLYHELDQKLMNYDKNNFEVIDERIRNVNKDKYKNESFELFRFELSNLINSKQYEHYKKSLKEFVSNKDINGIQNLILSICVNKLNNKIISYKNTVGPELVKIINDIPNIDYYKIKNSLVMVH